MSDNILLMPFVDESENFVNGFECGQIWELLQQGEEIESRPCHKANKEQLIKMFELFSCDYSFEDLKNGWIILNVKNTKI